MYGKLVIIARCLNLKWKLLLAAFMVLSWPSFITGRTKCYQPFGCFSTKYPFNHTIMSLPQSPTEVGSFFILYTRETELTFDDLKDETLKDAVSKVGNRKIKLIIHGLLESTSAEWIDRMTKALLKEGDYCLILVDWSNGANNLRASGNARLVGAQVGYMINKFKTMTPLVMKDIQLIGFSLGAHVAGYAGKWTRNFGSKIGRITGLDPGDLPTGILYENAHPDVRLDYQDADFVDVIHSDMTGFGLDAPIGHVDFYPNGGSDQPGCSALAMIGKFAENDFMYTLGCNHFRAVDYYIESINSNCKLTAYPCKNYRKYKRNKCRYCDGQCPTMGHKANGIIDKHKYRGTRLYLMTKSTSPYCLTEETSQRKKHEKSWKTLFSDLIAIFPFSG